MEGDGEREVERPGEEQEGEEAGLLKSFSPDFNII
jgi:hypothetical protein